MSRTLPRRAWLLLATASILLGCTTAGGNAAVVIQDVPYELTGTSIATVPPAIEPQGPFKLTLYFISEEDESLISVVRNREQPPQLQEAIDALSAGPTEAELALAPMRARFSESLNPIVSAPTAGLVVITVSDQAQLRDSSNRLPAQVLVCTLTEFDGVNAVQLRDSLGPIQLAGASAESIESEFARRENYNDCLATDVNQVAASLQPDETVNPDGESSAADQ